MAYPFPRFATAPPTPQGIQGIESPRMSGAYKPKSKPIPSRALLICSLTFTAILLWFVNPFSHGTRHTDHIPQSHELEDYFDHFEGHQDCGIRSADLYISPSKSPFQTGKGSSSSSSPYCRNRATLLDAMSGGGRHGFDAPFFPAGCHYRWYSTIEICMILDRFDAVVFIGDGMLQTVYSALNMLLRENLAMGGLKDGTFTHDERAKCRCDGQIMKKECAEHGVMSSADLSDSHDRNDNLSPYRCNRTPHLYLPITTSPAPLPSHETFAALLAAKPDSYKPVAVIHSLSLSTALSWPAATASMDEWLTIADAALRNVPFLWMGPTAAGHLKPPGRIMSEGNNALWHYGVEMGKEARLRTMDVLGQYNLTLQAGSWDGSGYGVRVGLVQAMMVINWLSRLETT